jgi:hypothetical protein
MIGLAVTLLTVLVLWHLRLLGQRYRVQVERIPETRTILIGGRPVTAERRGKSNSWSFDANRGELRFVEPAVMFDWRTAETGEPAQFGAWPDGQPEEPIIIRPMHGVSRVGNAPDRSLRE